MTPSTTIMVAGQKALANPTTRRAIIEAGKQILPYAGPIAIGIGVAVAGVWIATKIFE
jgi:hypothetical protein